jgi:isochorismate synthase
MQQKSNSTVLERQLIEDYQVGDFFWASPNRTLLGKGLLAGVPEEKGKENQREGLGGRVLAVLKHAQEHGRGNPLVVGAIPFDANKPVRLIVPESIRVSAPLQFPSVTALKSPLAAEYTITSVPESALYIRGVEKGLRYIQTGRLRKIVLARALRLASAATVDIRRLLHNLARQNTMGYTFAVDLSRNASGKFGGDGPLATGRTLVGASPELLLARTGLQLTANPLAGSRPRGEDPAADQRLAAELLASAKDLHEHEIVVKAVAAALRPYCRSLDLPDKSSLMHTETMWHLSTTIKGEIADPAVSALDLALALHPTPAVCGSPTKLAQEAIREIEPFDRGFFAGMVGWNDARGDGEWAVTIRCAEVEAHSLRLYAGAGVVAGSKPEDELAETAAKFGTMLIAMGLDKELVNQ